MNNAQDTPIPADLDNTLVFLSSAPNSLSLSSDPRQIITGQEGQTVIAVALPYRNPCQYHADVQGILHLLSGFRLAHEITVTASAYLESPALTAGGLRRVQRLLQANASAVGSVCIDTLNEWLSTNMTTDIYRHPLKRPARGQPFQSPRLQLLIFVSCDPLLLPAWSHAPRPSPAWTSAAAEQGTLNTLPRSIAARLVASGQQQTVWDLERYTDYATVHSDLWVLDAPNGLILWPDLVLARLVTTFSTPTGTLIADEATLATRLRAFAGHRTILYYTGEHTNDPGTAGSVGVPTTPRGGG